MALNSRANRGGRTRFQQGLSTPGFTDDKKFDFELDNDRDSHSDNGLDNLSNSNESQIMAQDAYEVSSIGSFNQYRRKQHKVKPIGKVQGPVNKKHFNSDHDDHDDDTSSDIYSSNLQRSYDKLRPITRVQTVESETQTDVAETVATGSQT